MNYLLLHVSDHTIRLWGEVNGHSLSKLSYWFAGTNANFLRNYDSTSQHNRSLNEVNLSRDNGCTLQSLTPRRKVWPTQGFSDLAEELLPQCHATKQISHGIYTTVSARATQISLGASVLVTGQLV